MRKDKIPWPKAIDDLRMLMLKHHFPAYLINRISAMYISEREKERMNKHGFKRIPDACHADKP